MNLNLFIFEVIDKINNLKCEGDINIQTITDLNINVNKNSITLIRTNFETISKIRIVHKNRLSVISSTDFSSPEDLVFSGIKLAKYGPKVNSLFRKTAKKIRKSLCNFDLNIADMNIEKMLDFTRNKIEKFQTLFNKSDCDFNLKACLKKITILDSFGVKKEAEQTNVFIKGKIRLPVKDEILTLRFQNGSSNLKIIDDYLPNIIFNTSLNFIDNYPFTKNKIPVIFTPAVLEALTKSIKLATGGAALSKKKSLYSYREGNRILSDKITILDDPYLEWGMRTYEFDDEGNECEKKTIVENGIFTSGIFDNYFGSLYKVKSTGNGFWSDSSLQIVPQYTNFILLTGNDKLEQVIKSLSQGIIVFSLIGNKTYNVFTGDYSLAPGYGMYIKNGEIIGFVKNIMISGNIFQDFKSKLIAISDAAETIGANLLPAVAIDNLAVSY